VGVDHAERPQGLQVTTQSLMAGRTVIGQLRNGGLLDAAQFAQNLQTYGVRDDFEPA